MSLNFKYIEKIFVILTICIVSLGGNPIAKNEVFDKAVLKQEKRFPNGTVLGGYNYTDKEGNPVAVKYYADESSYGVEFKSVKISGLPPPFFKNLDNPERPEVLDPEIDKDLDPFKTDPNSTPTTSDISLDLLKREENNRSAGSNSLDYEIFSQNVSSNPKKCNNEKVKVYYNTDKNRFERSSQKEPDDITKFCELVR